jgi:voltage-gated potassium channel
MTRKLIYAFLALVVIYLVGTFGYYAIGKGEWNIFECAYMTTITLTTVGYGEILSNFESNPAARLFTIFLLLIGMGVLLYAVSTVTAFLVEGELSNVIWRRKMEKAIAKLRNHFIVCGFGEIGIHIVEELLKTRRHFVVVENNPERILELKIKGSAANPTGTLYVEGDATNDEVLHNAGIKHAQGLICSLHSDPENLFLAITAKQLNPKIKVFSRCIDPGSQPKFLKAGADYVVSPQHIGAMRLISQMVRPDVVSFLDLMLRDTNRELRVEQVSLPGNSSLIGKTIADSNIKNHTGMMVMALKDSDSETWVYNPGADFILKPNCNLIVFGEMEGLEKLRELVTRE